MSNLKYAIAENEADVTDSLERAAKQQARPYLILGAADRIGVSITRHAEEALDFELAQGSMPA
jgi:hypothetical protein